MRLELSIASTEELPEVARNQRWTDSNGRLFAWSSGSAARGGLEVPGTGVFRFREGSDRIVAFVRPETDRARLQGTFHDLVVPLALQTRGWHALHASAVSTTGGVVCLCGRSGAGKSTLARAWTANGGEAWADDTLMFRIGDRGPETVRPDARSTAAGPLSIVGEPRLLAAVVVLEPAPTPSLGRDRIERLRPVAALDAVLPNALCLDAANAGLLRRLFRAYADLVKMVPIHRFRYRQKPGEIAETARRIARGIARGVARGRG